jgi:hypothetical protein
MKEHKWPSPVVLKPKGDAGALCGQHDVDDRLVVPPPHVSLTTKKLRHGIATHQDPGGEKLLRCSPVDVLGRLWSK